MLTDGRLGLRLVRMSIAYPCPIGARRSRTVPGPSPHGSRWARRQQPQKAFCASRALRTRRPACAANVATSRADRQARLDVRTQSNFLVQPPPGRRSKPVLKQQVHGAFRFKYTTTGAVSQRVGEFDDIALRELCVEFGDSRAASAHPFRLRNRVGVSGFHRSFLPSAYGAS